MSLLLSDEVAPSSSIGAVDVGSEIARRIPETEGRGKGRMGETG